MPRFNDSFGFLKSRKIIATHSRDCLQGIKPLYKFTVIPVKVQISCTFLRRVFKNILGLHSYYIADYLCAASTE